MRKVYVKEIDTRNETRGWSIWWTPAKGGTCTIESFSRWIGNMSGERWTINGVGLDVANQVADSDLFVHIDYYKSQLYSGVQRGSELYGWTCRSTGVLIR